MKRSRFTEQQIIAILKEQEAGVEALELCRRHGIGSPTFYKWKAKYGGLDVAEARRLKRWRTRTPHVGILKNVAGNAVSTAFLWAGWPSVSSDPCAASHFGASAGTFKRRHRHCGPLAGTVEVTKTTV
jgi:hypothetical protein